MGSGGRVLAFDDECRKMLYHAVNIFSFRVRIEICGSRWAQPQSAPDFGGTCGKR
jgi:hypothetical protein